MQSLEAELERARNLDIDELADAIESIGFECTRCGACCKGVGSTSEETSDDAPRGDADAGEPHTATVFPDEVRELRAATGHDEPNGEAASGSRSDGPREWRDVARPMPYGLEDGEGETFEWALRTDACGDCAFYEEAPDGTGACSVHADRPLICETYPFSVALGGTSQPMGDPVDEKGMVRAHECEGLGRDIDRERAEELAAALEERAVRELEEAIAVRDEYEPAGPDEGVVVHDSEGAKRPDGSAYEG